MPSLTVQLHELFDRASEIPNVVDCYLIDIQGPEDSLWTVPYAACMFDALASVWFNKNDKEDWMYQWGWDKKNNPEGRVRIGCNTETTKHPITLTFQWGEGHPTGGLDVIMLPHERAQINKKHCRWCHGFITSRPEDCARRRLRALAVADSNERNIHLKAVALWHSHRPYPKL